MTRRQHLAVIGSGASSIYLLKHLLKEAGVLKPHLGQISIFEKSPITGMGMPYNPRTTDRFNMSNISSEELPELMVSFGDWLRAQEPEVLKALDLENTRISDSEVYSRLALGRYLNAQYLAIIATLREKEILVHEYPDCEVLDVLDDAKRGEVTLLTARGESPRFDKVIIATGHCWAGEDKPDEGYYASPWPISKLLPPEGGHHNFAIGTLGASLSAFDVIASLAHRHGEFVRESGTLKFIPHPGTENFKIVMHSAHGLLPHLQFDQEEPFREIYRHVGRDALLGLVDERGFLRMETYYDKVCRPALGKAFARDGMPEMVALLEKQEFGLREFVARMTGDHDYPDAFEGMRLEMVEAEKSVLEHKPIHWKEVIDDLMYTLNFHAELMPAEDHLLLQSLVMPFLLNVVAAMPLNSGNTILALHDAGKLDIVAGKVSPGQDSPESDMTTVTVENEGVESSFSYRLFIDCSGQKPLQAGDYPFPDLVKKGGVRKARAPFADPKNPESSLHEEKKEQLFKEGGEWLYAIGGVDIDGCYHLTGEGGRINPRIHDIAFPHTSGIRPYSYGLQACSHTSAILVRAWTEEIKGSDPLSNDPEGITDIYLKVQEET